MLEEGLEPTATSQLVQRFLGRDFFDSGYNVSIDSTGYRDPKYCLKDYDFRTGALQVRSLSGSAEFTYASYPHKGARRHQSVI